MDPLSETDSEIEAKARDQAQAIAESRAQALARTQASGLQGFFRGIGRGLRLSKEQVSANIEAVQKPGRELLLWQMRQAEDLKSAWDTVFVLFEEPRFIASVPAGRDCPIAEFKAQRKWAEAAAEWASAQNEAAEAWLRCDRKLILRREGQGVGLHLVCHDQLVRFDQKSKKLLPVRSETREAVAHDRLRLLQDKFPNLTAADLASGLRSPTRAFTRDARRGATDAYVRNGPLVANLEVFLIDRNKKKKDETQDPGKGFLTWLSGLIKSSGGK